MRWEEKTENEGGVNKEIEAVGIGSVAQLVVSV